MPNCGTVKKNKLLSIENIIPEASGYLVVDPKKCTGCASCMFACSLAHEGKSNLLFSRIQILDDPLGYFPTDIQPEKSPWLLWLSHELQA